MDLPERLPHAKARAESARMCRWAYAAPYANVHSVSGSYVPGRLRAASAVGADQRDAAVEVAAEGHLAPRLRVPICQEEFPKIYILIHVAGNFMYNRASA